MDQDLTKKIQARLEELPEDIRKAVQSADVGKKIQELGTKHALHLDQIGNLGDEIYMVMLGFTDPAEFAENLAKELNLPKEKAGALAQDVGTSLFVPIRESMQEFMEERALHEAVLEEGKAPAVQTTPAVSAAKITTPPPPATPRPPVVPAPALQKPPVAAPPPVVPPKPIEAHPADLMLTQKTVSVAPQAPKPQSITPATPVPPKPAAPAAPVTPKPATPPPPAPQPYKTDPYREPTN